MSSPRTLTFLKSMNEAESIIASSSISPNYTEEGMRFRVKSNTSIIEIRIYLKLLTYLLAINA